jgi:hypothetical protein
MKLFNVLFLTFHAVLFSSVMWLLVYSITLSLLNSTIIIILIAILSFMLAYEFRDVDMFDRL